MELNDSSLKLVILLNDDERMQMNIFCTINKIYTIGDFLKHGDVVRNIPALKNVIDELKKNGIKFDDELTKEELNLRNIERGQINMTNDNSNLEYITFFSKDYETFLECSDAKFKSFLRKIKRFLGRSGIEINNIKDLIKNETLNYIVMNFNAADVDKFYEALNDFAVKNNVNIDSVRAYLDVIKKFSDSELEKQPEEILTDDPLTESPNQNKVQENVRDVELYSVDEIEHLKNYLPDAPAQPEELIQPINIDIISLMENKISKMKLQKQTVVDENTRKKGVLTQYVVLKNKLDRLIEKNKIYDKKISQILGIDRPETVVEKDYNSIQELENVIQQLKQEVERKQILLEQFNSTKKELQAVLYESERLDLEIEKLITPRKENNI